MKHCIRVVNLSVAIVVATSVSLLAAEKPRPPKKTGTSPRADASTNEAIRRGLRYLEKNQSKSERRLDQATQRYIDLLAGLKQYRLDFKIVEVQEETDGNALAIKVHPHPFKRWKGKGQQEHRFTSLSCLNCHSVPGKGDSNEFFLKSFHGNSAWLDTWVKNTKGVKILASPTLVVTAGRTASMAVGSPRKAQYFQRLKNGNFTLKEEMVETGITVKTTVQPAADGNVRLKRLTVSVAAIKGREKIPGVTLSVGKPIMTTTSISTSILSKLGKSSVISIDSPRGGRVLISVKVTVVVPGKTRVDPRGTTDREPLPRKKG